MCPIEHSNLSIYFEVTIYWFIHQLHSMISSWRQAHLFLGFQQSTDRNSPTAFVSAAKVLREKESQLQVQLPTKTFRVDFYVFIASTDFWCRLDP